MLEIKSPTIIVQSLTTCGIVMTVLSLTSINLVTACSIKNALHSGINTASNPKN